MCILKAAALTNSLEFGKAIHAELCKLYSHIPQSLQIALANMYIRNKDLENAATIVNKLDLKTASLLEWNVLMSAYADSGFVTAVKHLYTSMQQAQIQPDSITYISIFSCFTDPAAKPEAEKIYSQLINADVDLSLAGQNALLNMLTNCDMMQIAVNFFESMDQKDVVTFTTMISAHIKYGNEEMAHNLYQDMKTIKITPKASTYRCLFGAFAELGFSNEV